MSADEEAESDGDMDRHVSSGLVEHCADHCHHDQIACRLSTSSSTGQVMPIVAGLWLGHSAAICLKSFVLFPYSSDGLLPTVIVDGLTLQLVSSSGILSYDQSSINNTLYNSS